MSIIAVSGKMQSGKNTVASIINKLTNNKYKEKAFADKLKDIVCLLTGCTREQLEDQEFKNKELGEEWWYYYYDIGGRKLYPYLEYKDNEDYNTFLFKHTYRSLLQQIGTDLFRNQLHENVWINSLISGYKKNVLSHYKLRESGREYFDEDPIYKHPNWIITDMRFPNELKAIKDRGGISIRVKRSIPKEQDVNQSLLGAVSNYKEHPSETALDEAVFDYEINNDGTIEELIERVREILIKEKMI